MPKVLDYSTTKIPDFKKPYILEKNKKAVAVVLPFEVYESLTKVKDKDIEIYSNQRLRELLAEDKIS